MCDLNGCGPGAASDPIPVPDEQRRRFLKGLATLPLAVVLSDPRLARAAGERLENVTIPLADGKVGGVLATPATTPAPAVLLIHEWWGLNDQIKAVTAEFANAGFLAFAIDLYNGAVATTREDAQAAMKAVDPALATRQLVAAAEWLRKHPKGNGKVGTVGWCFGGGWSLNTSLATPIDATVIYYGSVKKTADELKPLQGPVLGHFATLDKSINAEMVSGFEKAMAEAGKRDLTVHWYEADHAFANPTSARYDQEDTALAWQRTLAFLRKHLG